jgi:hypothetical protein
MKQVFGWWHLDSEALALINAVSGERIRFRDRRLIEQPEEVQGSIRLDYEYSDLRYPLVVESLPRTVEYGLPGTSGPVSSRNWRLDHVRSAETWRREQNQDAAHPPYGVWRRVDDCATDGLACWPETSARLAGNLDVLGGWWNGHWTSGLHRRIGCVGRFSYPSYQPDFTVHAVSTPMPLDLQPPSPFVFQEADKSSIYPGAPRTWDERHALDASPPLAGLQSVAASGIDEANLIPTWPPRLQVLQLPRSQMLTGFEHRVPVLLSRDRRRILFFPATSSTAPERGTGHYSGLSLPLLYVDDDVICRFEAKARSGGEWSPLLFRLFGFGTRDDSPNQGLGLVQHRGWNLPGWALWLRLLWAFLDGWPNWRGAVINCSGWKEEVSLGDVKRITFFDGYYGGLGLGARYELDPRTINTLRQSGRSLVT